MLGLIVAVTLSASPSLEAVNPSTQTAEYILTLRPKVGAKRAKELASYIDRWATHYDLDPTLMTAIIMHESRFKSGIKACWPHAKKPGVITCDRGVAQINEAWIRQWKLDEDRLQYDDSYNIRIQARILASIKKESAAKDPNWFGRYHSKTPKFKARYLAKLAPILEKAPQKLSPDPVQLELVAMVQ